VAIRKIFGAVPEASAESLEGARLPEPALVAS